MREEPHTGPSSASRRFSAASWAVLGLAVLLISIFGAFIWTHVGRPSDGARFHHDSSAWRPNGVEVSPIEEERTGIREGDVVVAVEGRPLESWIRDTSAPWTARSRWDVGQTVRYTVERDGNAVDVSLTLEKYPLGAVLTESWGTILTVFLFALVSSFVFFTRPGDPAARVLLLFSAAALVSTIWPLGLEPIDLTLGLEFWLFTGANSVAYVLVWIALVHFWLVFPRPAELVQRRTWVVPALYLVPYAINIVSAGVMWSGAVSTLDWLGRADYGADWTPIAYMVLALVVMVWRYRTSLDPVSRLQVRWVVFAFAIFITLVMGLGILPEVLLGEPLISWNAQSLLASPVLLAMAIGVSRHRLFDIEAKVNRTLVYAGLTALVVGIYVVIVGLAGALFQASDNLLVSLVAVGLAAVLFQPLRERLQRAVNRLLYGERDDPYAVLSQLGQRLQATLAPESALTTIVETVAQALKLPYAAIALKQGDQMNVAAVYGRPTPDIVSITLAHQGEAMGQMLLAPRAPGSPSVTRTSGCSTTLRDRPG